MRIRIRLRPGLFFLMLLVLAASMVAATHRAKSLTARLGAWHAVPTGAAAYGLVTWLAHQLFSAIDEVPTGFPASLLWQFRLTFMGIHLVLGSGLGLIFGGLVERQFRMTSCGVSRR